MNNETKKKLFSDIDEYSKMILSGTSQEKLEAFQKKISDVITPYLEQYEEFRKEYEVVMPLVDSVDSLEYAHITLDEDTYYTLADVAYRILNYVRSLAIFLNLEVDEVVQKSSEDLQWYQQKYKKMRETYENSLPFPAEIILIPQTSQPKNLVLAKDKITNKFFEGSLSLESKDIEIATERKNSKKELTAVVSIDFEELPDVSISKSIEPYDREVHDAIVSLYVDGENEFVTPLMIYRTMTGNPKATFTDKKEKEISDSVSKCSMTRITINTSEEAEAYGMDKLSYEGNLIYTEKIIGEHKGEVSEWIRILKKPILYDYANDKNQVARVPIQLLNTSINKNDETIVLQGYLLRRILAMKGSKLSKNIVYDTVYKHLNISAASAGALRKKQSKIRDNAKRILNDWKEQGFIKTFKENKKQNSIVSLTISFN